MRAFGPIPVLVLLLVLMILCGVSDRAHAAAGAGPSDRDNQGQGNQDWPCFLLRDGAQFTASLEHDVDTSRQRLLTKVLGDLERDATVCPAMATALANFRRDLTSLFDETISKQRVLDRLRPRWTKRWSAAQCAEVEAVAKSANVDTLMSGDNAGAEAASLPDLWARWSRLAEANPALRDKGIAQRIKDTLIDMRTELEAVQHEANAALARALPPLITRDKQAAMTAVDSCITTEQNRLAHTPDAGASAGAGAGAGAGSGAAAAAVLSIDPPAPFVVTRDRADTVTVMTLRSSTGKPAAVQEDGSLCQLMFAEDPEDTGKTQQQLNARASEQPWQQSLLDRLRAGMEVDHGQPFDLLGIRGTEFQGIRHAVGGEPKAGIYLTMLDTPKGRTVLTCATPADGFKDALATFRSIRDAIRPPR
jgi:hypothetical protein